MPRSDSDPLKLRVQFIAQLDECAAGYAVMPLRAQPLNHFGNQTLCASPAAMSELLYYREEFSADSEKRPRYGSLNEVAARQGDPVAFRVSEE